jgi:radical SAM-linked protein
MLRRARVEMVYSKGYHPKPDMSFSPALGLGVHSLCEVVDLRIELDRDSGQPPSAAELERRLIAAAPEGLCIERVVELPAGAPALSKLIEFMDVAVGLPPNAGQPPLLDLSRLTNFAAYSLSALRHKEGSEPKSIDVGRYLRSVELPPQAVAEPLRQALEWSPELTIVLARLQVFGDGGAKPSEVAEALLGQRPPAGTRYARTGLYGQGGADLCDLIDPLPQHLVALPPPLLPNTGVEDLLPAIALANGD